MSRRNDKRRKVDIKSWWVAKEGLTEETSE